MAILEGSTIISLLLVPYYLSNKHPIFWEQYSTKSIYFVMAVGGLIVAFFLGRLIEHDQVKDSGLFTPLQLSKLPKESHLTYVISTLMVVCAYSWVYMPILEKINAKPKTNKVKKRPTA